MLDKISLETGVCPMGILWVALILMKIMHIIDWSWLIVFVWPVPVWLLIFACFLLTVGFCNGRSFA